jgi:branched-chain amino acid transport system permease protein
VLLFANVELGGLGSTVGVVISDLVMTLLFEVLREFGDIRMLVFGVLMVVMMMWRPRGLIRISRSGFAIRKGVAP